MSSKHHQHQHQTLPLAVRAVLSRLSQAEAGALSSHAQLRRLAASAAFDVAMELVSSSSSLSQSSSSSGEASRSLDAVIDACLSHGSEVREREKEK